MKTTSRKAFAAVAFAVMLTVNAPAQDDAKTDVVKTASAKPTRSELRDKQIDVSLEARDIERVLGKLKRASDLAKSRITEAASTTESASTSLEKGDSKRAREDAQQATEMFQEIIKQLEALLAEETPQRVASARNLATQLARLQRQFAQQISGAMNPSQANRGNRGQGSGGRGQQEKTNKEGGDPKQDPKEGAGAGGKKKDDKGGDDPKAPMPAGGGEGYEKDKDDRAEKGSGSGKDKTLTEEEMREALARRAEQLAKTGETLKDVLQAISQSNDPADKEAVAKLEAILKETDLLNVLEAMQQEADRIRSGKLDDARLASLDLAERLEITAQRLDAAYRGIIAPQAEELRKLEQALADLREKMENLETQAQVAAWHREAQELLDRAEKLGISDKVREEFLEEMKKAGLGVNGQRNNFNWGLVNDRYTAPNGYVINLSRVQEEVQIRIQSLLLGDISSATDEATPPKYQDLVERYYKVLSGTQSEKPQISNSKSQGNPKPETKQGAK